MDAERDFRGHGRGRVDCYFEYEETGDVDCKSFVHMGFILGVRPEESIAKSNTYRHLQVVAFRNQSVAIRSGMSNVPRINASRRSNYQPSAGFTPTDGFFRGLRHVTWENPPVTFADARASNDA